MPLLHARSTRSSINAANGMITTVVPHCSTNAGNMNDTLLQYLPPSAKRRPTSRSLALPSPVPLPRPARESTTSECAGETASTPRTCPPLLRRSRTLALPALLSAPMSLFRLSSSHSLRSISPSCDSVQISSPSSLRSPHLLLLFPLHLLRPLRALLLLSLIALQKAMYATATPFTDKDSASSKQEHPPARQGEKVFVRNYLGSRADIVQQTSGRAFTTDSFSALESCGPESPDSLCTASRLIPSSGGVVSTLQRLEIDADEHWDVIQHLTSFLGISFAPSSVKHSTRRGDTIARTWLTARGR